MITYGNGLTEVVADTSWSVDLGQRDESVNLLIDCSNANGETLVFDFGIKFLLEDGSLSDEYKITDGASTAAKLTFTVDSVIAVVYPIAVPLSADKLIVNLGGYTGATIDLKVVGSEFLD